MPDASSKSAVVAALFAQAGLLRCVLGHLEHPRHNARPEEGYKGEPIFVCVDGTPHEYLPGVPVTITTAEAEVLSATKRYSVTPFE